MFDDRPIGPGIEDHRHAGSVRQAALDGVTDLLFVCAINVIPRALYRIPPGIERVWPVIVNEGALPDREQVRKVLDFPLTAGLVVENDFTVGGLLRTVGGLGCYRAVARIRTHAWVCSEPERRPDVTRCREPRVLIVGRGRRKQIHEFFAALQDRHIRKLRQLGASFTVVGDSWPGDLTHLLGELSIRVIDWPLTDSEVEELYVRHAYLLNPSYAENICLPVREAAARGLSVVTFSVPGVSEYLAGNYRAHTVVHAPTAMFRHVPGLAAGQEPIVVATGMAELADALIDALEAYKCHEAKLAARDFVELYSPMQGARDFATTIGVPGYGIAEPAAC